MTVLPTIPIQRSLDLEYINGRVWDFKRRAPVIPICAAVLAIATAAQADPCEAPLPKPGTVFSGPVSYVGDGDSLCVDVGSTTGILANWVEVRIADFYAPELHDAGGREAKAALSRIAMGQRVQCVAGRKSYDRVVAVCRLHGRSVGDLMRAAGIEEGGRGR